MNLRRKQEELVRNLLRGSALSGALPNASEVEEMQRLRLPPSAINRVRGYAAGLAESVPQVTNRGALRRTADELTASVMEDIGDSPTNHLTEQDHADAHRVRADRQGGVIAGERGIRYDTGGVIDGRPQGDDPGWRQ